MLKNYVSVVIACVFSISQIWASPSGLNNIPTADTAPHRTLVFQEYTDFGEGLKPSHFLGFKTGLLDFSEIGIDRKIGSGKSGAYLFQAKLKWDPRRFGYEENWPVFAAGVANIAWTSHGRELSGQPFPYSVASYELKKGDVNIVRCHFGFDLQNDNEGFFIGLDRQVIRGLTLRVDSIMVNNAQDLLSSIGFIYGPGWPFPLNIALEGWYSISTQDERGNDAIIKLDYILRY